MIDVRFFEHGQTMMNSVITETMMEVLPNVGDFIMIDPRDPETMYEVKACIFMTGDLSTPAKGQQVAISVVGKGQGFIGWTNAL